MYPVTKRAKEMEFNTIKNILHDKEYNTNLIGKPTLPQKQNIHLILSVTKQNGSPLHTVAKM
jgi:hypothetical protein